MIYDFSTVLQSSVATRVNDGRIFNDFVIANLLVSSVRFVRGVGLGV